MNRGLLLGIFLGFIGVHALFHYGVLEFGESCRYYSVQEYNLETGRATVTGLGCEPAVLVRGF